LRFLAFFEGINGGDHDLVFFNKSVMNLQRLVLTRIPFSSSVLGHWFLFFLGLSESLSPIGLREIKGGIRGQTQEELGIGSSDNQQSYPGLAPGGGSQHGGPRAKLV
jgi:hypothetical protein